MNVAFLFNSDHPDLGNSYGMVIKDKMIDIRILPNAKRHMRVSVGDILTYGRVGNVDELKVVYTPATYDRLRYPALEETFNRATVYCWFFKNITQEIADKIDQALDSSSYYLGAMDIDYTKPYQVGFFDCFLIERYRLQGNKISFFYSMGSDEDPQICDEKDFKNAGFEVAREDRGARKTIFDDYYDSMEGHRRIYFFWDYFKNDLGWDEDEISDLVFNLEELHPYLFNILYSCCVALRVADVKEQLSQAQLSGRRFVEHLADFLFPPQDEALVCQDGTERDVGKRRYINRLAIYIERTMLEKNEFSADELNRMRKEISGINKTFCRGVHKPFSDEKGFNDEADKTNKAVSNLGHWLLEVINIEPAAVRRPYLAYNQNIIDFFDESIR